MAGKNMADRRFKMFEANIHEVIEAGMYDKENYQLIKNFRRDMEENIVKYVDILTYLVCIQQRPKNTPQR